MRIAGKECREGEGRCRRKLKWVRHLLANANGDSVDLINFDPVYCAKSTGALDRDQPRADNEDDTCQKLLSVV